MSELRQRNEAFKAFLETLNPAQRLAVEKIEGPVLVIAGPGTGKTHLLAARIGNILLNTDARAQNVLCLTFTDAGVNAMRKRLLERIGPEAHRTPVFTFHGFCNRVIQDNSESFGTGILEPLSDLERIEIVRELLAELPVSHPLRIGKKDPFLFESQLRDLFANMKKEGWTPGFVLRRCDEFVRGLPANPDFVYQKNSKYGKKGEPKTALIKDTTEKMERLKAAADLFPKYQRALEDNGRYEYEDMLLWVNKAFEAHKPLLQSYQERYQYILVDEFQDTNGAQFKLLNQLLDYWETPNIFIVGDDDQSIYEFQGARLENLLHFADQYRRGLEVVVLHENYRSTQGILDAAGRVVANNEIRAIARMEPPLEKILHARAQETSEPVVLQYETRLHELTGIVQRIKALIESGTPAEEIAVLYSRHKQAAPFLQLLGKSGIPYQTRKPENILEIPVIQHFRALLQYLWEEGRAPYSGEHRLFRLLHAAFWKLDSLDLALIAAAGNVRKMPVDSEDNKPLYGLSPEPQEGEGFSWRRVLNNPAYLKTLDLHAFEQLSKLGQQLSEWITDAANLPLPQLIERLYAQTGILDWAMKQADAVWYLQVLNSFMQAIPQYRLRAGLRKRWEHDQLGYFLDTLNSMDANALPLPLQQMVETEPGVQLLTAHAAKGLEFEQVFLIDCVDDAWEKSAGDSRGRFQYPPTLTLSGEEDLEEARRRLFYVAMTRAKRGLTISFASRGNDGKPLVQSRFVDETGLDAVQETPAAALVLEAQSKLLLEPAKPVIRLPENEVVDALLANFVLSITAMNRYLRCPLAFWYEDLLRVPAAMSEAAAFGIAMHATLQRFVLRMKSDKKFQWPGAEALSRMFVHEMERMRGYFSETGFHQRLALGRENLRRIHAEQVPFWRKRAIVERRVSQVELNSVPMTGVIDKIEWLENGRLRLVDYKTGTPDTKKTAFPGEQQPFGGEYWRQLAFYQLLIESAGIYPEKVGKTAVSWLEADKKGAFPLTEISFEKPDLEMMTSLIAEVYSKIRNQEFNTGCGKPDCIWCNMHRENEWKERPGASEEGLDD